jgi:mono/diheme cytochrome c family protein
MISIRTLLVRVAGISPIALTVLFSAACSGSPTSTRSSNPPAATESRDATGGGATAATPAPVASPANAQAQQGAALFAQACARCHGAAGEGTPQAPAVIGRGALPTNPPAGRRLRTGTFTTAKDIGMFVKDQMPPGSHTPADQTAAILTYLLQSNGVPTNGSMNPSTAASIPWRR